MSIVSTVTETATPATETPVIDKFDPSRLKLSQDFGAELGVKKAMLTVPVRKPSNEWWVQTHADPAYRLATYVLALKEENENYLVDQSLWSELSSEPTFGARMLYTAINRQGVVFLWLVRMPGPDGKLDPWNTSAMEAAERASRGWIRMASNRSLGAYEMYESEAKWPDPTWPTEPFADLLRVAFKGKFIDNMSHPVLKRLRGEQ